MLFLSEFSQKGNLTKTFVIILNIKFHKYPSGGSRLVRNVQRNRQTDRRTNVKTNLTKVVDLLSYSLTYLLTYLLTFLLTQRSRVLLDNLRGSQLSINSPHFPEPEGSLQHSQVPPTCRYPEPYISSPCSHIPLPEDPSKYYYTIYA